MTITVKPIKTEEDYQEALTRIDVLLGAKTGSKEEDELNVLTDLVWAYEERHYPIDPPNDPLEVIKFWMDQKNLKESDLIPHIGSETLVHDILSGKAELTVEMIIGLHKALGISLDSLYRS